MGKDKDKGGKDPEKDKGEEKKKGEETGEREENEKSKKDKSASKDAVKEKKDKSKSKEKDKSRKEKKRDKKKKKKKRKRKHRDDKASDGKRRKRRRKRIKRLSDELLRQRIALKEVVVENGGDLDTIQYVRKYSHSNWAEDEDVYDQNNVDLNRQSFVQDGTEIMTVHVIGKNFLKVLKPMVAFGRIVARYPITHTVTSEGFVFFQYNPYHPYAITFFLSNIFCTSIFIMGVVVAFCLWLNVPLGVDFMKKEQLADKYLKKYMVDYKDIQNSTTKKVELWLRNRPERYLFDRHVAIFISVWAYLLHSIISGWKIHFSRNELLQYYNYWMRAMYTMKMDVTKGATNRVYFLCGAYAAFIICYVILASLHVLPTMSGLPAVVGAILVRPFDPYFMDINYNDTKKCFNGMAPCFSKVFTITREVATLLLSYLISVGTFYALWFTMICKCLRNGFAIWNSRLYSILLAAKDARQSRSSRTTYILLFKDHVTLLDLMEATDKIFSGIIESYFGLQALSYCFEFEFIIRTVRAGYDEDEAVRGDFFVRRHDWIAGTIVLAIHSVYVFVTVRGAAEVGEEALTGLEIIRRRSLLGRKSDAELYFLMSLFASYTAHKPIAPSGYGFFTCNRAFILGITATVLTYLTLVYQFDPKYDFQRELQDSPRRIIQEFICLAEQPRFNLLSARECHNLVIG